MDMIKVTKNIKKMLANLRRSEENKKQKFWIRYKNCR